MQILIYYLTEKNIIKENETIINVIYDTPYYLKFSYDFYKFFINEGKNFTLNNIVDLFCFFEQLCFNDLVKTLQNEYRALIPEDIKNKIIEKLIKNPDKEDKIPIKSLGTATRRLISRYLAGKMQVTDIKEDRPLANDLSREEFWDEKIGKLEKLEDILVDKLKDFKLTVGQAYEFYNLIGEEDRKTLNFIEEK